MRYLYFILAGLGCAAAIGLRALTGAPWAPLVALIVAAIFLVLGLRESMAPARSYAAEDLSAEQEKELRRLLDAGQSGTAVKQVQLWFRGISYEKAEQIVHSLR